MTKTLRTTRRTNLAPIISNGLRFSNSTGSLSGHASTPCGFGEIDPSGPDYAHQRDCGEVIDYTIYSYDTPIAWHTPSGWYVVGQKFSTTTSCHQGQVRRAIAEIEKPRTVVCAPSPAVLSELMRMA
jgi:hypothetical protein